MARDRLRAVLRLLAAVARECPRPRAARRAATWGSSAASIGGLWRRPALARPHPRRLPQVGVLRRDRRGGRASGTSTRTGRRIRRRRRWSCPASPGATWSFAGHASDIYLDARHAAREDPRGEVRADLHAATTRTTSPASAGRTRRTRSSVSYHGVDLDRFQPLPARTPGPFRILTVGHAAGLQGPARPHRGLPAPGRPRRRVRVRDRRRRRGTPRAWSGSSRAGPRRSRSGSRASWPRKTSSRSTSRPASWRYRRCPKATSASRTSCSRPSRWGRPWSAPPLPSLSEFMEDGVHGLFVPEQSPTALADALESLARDPERGRAIGAAGRRQIEALFDAKKNVAALEPLFRSATAPAASLPKQRDPRGDSPASTGHPQGDLTNESTTSPAARDDARALAALAMGSGPAKRNWRPPRGWPMLGHDARHTGQSDLLGPKFAGARAGPE